jgi:CRP-like cAMP-binding protein
MKDLDIDVAWEGPPQCRDCGVRHLVLFADLRHEDFRLIHKPIDELTYPEHETIYHAGDDGKYVYTIRKGLVKLVQYLPNGDQRIVRLLRPGDLAGMEALLGQSYQHSSIVVEPVLVCRIPISVIEQLSKETPRLHLQLLARWQRALNAADAWLTHLATGPARARIARLLIWLEESCATDIYYLPSREDIGAMLGITTETASRLIAEFKREGLLRTFENHRATADISALQLIANE